MILFKTQSGQQALKERHGNLTSRQRSAFILFDGKRSTEQVLAATAGMGITMVDVQGMVDSGLLEKAIHVSANGVSAPQARASDLGATESDPYKSTGERYQDAYMIATELTSALGLRGLPLTLAVEAASGYKELLALAPKIRAAVGESKFLRLAQALQG